MNKHRCYFSSMCLPLFSMCLFGYFLGSQWFSSLVIVDASYSGLNTDFAYTTTNLTHMIRLIGSSINDCLNPIVLPHGYIAY